MIGGIITQLMDIQNRLVPDIEANVALLGDQVETLSDHIDGVVVSKSISPSNITIINVYVMSAA